jgi:hypothetical protein
MATVTTGAEQQFDDGDEVLADDFGVGIRDLVGLQVDALAHAHRWL